MKNSAQTSSPVQEYQAIRIRDLAPLDQQLIHIIRDSARPEKMREIAWQLLLDFKRSLENR